MSDQLTKEYFDSQIARVATKDDIAALGTQIDDLAAMTAREFEAVKTQLDVTSRVATLEKQMAELRQALHLSSQP